MAISHYQDSTASRELVVSTSFLHWIYLSVCLSQNLSGLTICRMWDCFSVPVFTSVSPCTLSAFPIFWSPAGPWVWQLSVSCPCQPEYTGTDWTPGKVFLCVLVVGTWHFHCCSPSLTPIVGSRLWQISQVKSIQSLGHLCLSHCHQAPVLLSRSYCIFQERSKYHFARKVHVLRPAS